MYETGISLVEGRYQQEVKSSVSNICHSQVSGPGIRSLDASVHRSTQARSVAYEEFHVLLTQ